MTKKTAILLFASVGRSFDTIAKLKIDKDTIWESRVLPLGFFSAGRDLAREYATKNNLIVNTHVAHYEDGILTRDCDKCGLDLMHLSHRKPECTCDRDPLGDCPAYQHAVLPIRAAVWNAILADCLKELPGQRLYRVVFGLCLDCGRPENPERESRFTG